METIKIINLTPENIANYGVCGYKDVNKHIELRNEIEWVKEYYPKGLRIKTLISEQGGYQGMLELRSSLSRSKSDGNALHVEN
jgi:hypothetical protein